MPPRGRFQPAINKRAFFIQDTMGRNRALGNRLRAGNSGGFSPASLFASGEQGAWYDPSDLSTLFQDSAGTTPVTASGQPVGKMLDKSGRGNHATQGTAAARPIYTVVASRAYLLFDGADDCLVSGTVSAMSQPVTTCVGVNVLASTANGYVYDSVSGTQLSMYTKLSNVMGLGAGTELLATTTYTVPGPFVQMGIHNTASSSLRQNGASSSPTATDGTGTSNGITLGRFNGGTNFLNHHLYGMVYIARTLTAGEIASVEAYMNGKAQAY